MQKDQNEEQELEQSSTNRPDNIQQKKPINLGQKITQGISNVFSSKSPKHFEQPEKKISVTTFNKTKQSNSTYSQIQKIKVPSVPQAVPNIQFEEEKGQDIKNFEYLYNSLKSLSEDSIKKLNSTIKILTHDPIDRQQLSQVIIYGINEDMQPSRAIIWRILIGQYINIYKMFLRYLPPTQKQWVIILEKNVISYKKLIEENILIKIKKQQQQKDSQTQTGVLKANDHPLNRSKESSWNNYFEDQKLWAKIEKDTKRTRQKEGFFQLENFNKFYQDSDTSLIAVLSKNRSNMIQEYNYDVLTRILFLFAKLHNGLYVQGMNEIAALILYCFAKDSSSYLRHQAECDAFYCFIIVMSELKENYKFTTNGDDKVENNEFLKERIRIFQDLLKKLDAKLFDHFQKLNIDLKFFCVKWFIAQLAQELQINQTLQIWDSIICHQYSMNEFVHYLSLSILMLLRESLIQGQFGEINKIQIHKNYLLMLVYYKRNIGNDQVQNNIVKSLILSNYVSFYFMNKKYLLNQKIIFFIIKYIFLSIFKNMQTLRNSNNNENSEVESDSQNMVNDEQFSIHNNNHHQSGIINLQQDNYSKCNVEQSIINIFKVNLYLELIEVKANSLSYIEFVPNFDLNQSVLYNGNISLNNLISKLKKLGILIYGRLISYKSNTNGLYINCGTDPLHQEIQIPYDEVVDQKLTLRFKDSGQSLIHLIMSEEMNDAVNRMREGNDVPKDTLQKKPEQDQQQKICRRTKERRIGFIIDKVVQWREQYNGIKDTKGNFTRQTLDEAAKQVGISKKSLDDYLLQIRYGRKYGFNFNEHKNDKVGVLRAFVKKYNILNSKTKNSRGTQKIYKYL